MNDLEGTSSLSRSQICQSLLYSFWVSSKQTVKDPVSMQGCVHCTPPSTLAMQSPKGVSPVSSKRCSVMHKFKGMCVVLSSLCRPAELS